MVDKNIFLEEIDDLQKKKEERIEELQQFKTEETPNVFSLLMDSFVQSPTSSIIKAAERDESFFNAKEMKEIFSQRKGIEKYGLNRETFEAVGLSLIHI